MFSKKVLKQGILDKSLPSDILHVLEEHVCLTNTEIARKIEKKPAAVSSSTNSLWKRGLLHRFQSQDGLPWRYCLPKHKFVAELWIQVKKL
jgi:predicted transcriptional regulator